MESSPFANGDSSSYFIFPRGGESSDPDVVISTRTGEIPQTTNAADSGWSEQRWIKDAAGKVIGMDSRGKFKRGELWRTAIFMGHDFASYSLHSEKPAKSLDGIIESACIAKR
jgi:hypothetical protein